MMAADLNSASSINPASIGSNTNTSSTAVVTIDDNEEYTTESNIDTNIHEINFIHSESDQYQRSMNSDYPKVKMWSSETSTTPSSSENYSVQIERMRQETYTNTQKRRFLFCRALVLKCVCVGIVAIPIFAWVTVIGRDSARVVGHQVQELIEENKNKVLFSRLPDSTTTLRRLVFGSCSSQEKTLGYWDTVASLIPDVTVLVGNNVYAQCDDLRCDGLRMAYMALANHVSFLGAKGRLPMIQAMDDQDYGVDFSDENNPYKDSAKQLFLEFFEIPKSDDRWREGRGAYTSYLWGVHGRMVQVIVLDVRYYRSPFLETDTPMAPKKEKYIPDTNKQKTMLGEEQWAWFEHQLTVPVDIRVIISSIQVLAEGHGYECWRMLPHERRRFLIAVANAKGGIPFVLSGNRRVGGFYEMEDYGVVELTASSWTNTIPYGAFNDCKNADQCDEKDRRRKGDLIRENNFGSVDIDWENRKVMLTVRRADSSLAQDVLESDAGENIDSRTFNIPKIE